MKKISGKIWLDNQNQNKKNQGYQIFHVFFCHKFLILTSLDTERFGETIDLKAKTW